VENLPSQQDPNLGQMRSPCGHFCGQSCRDVGPSRDLSDNRRSQRRSGSGALAAGGTALPGGPRSRIMTSKNRPYLFAVVFAGPSWTWRDLEVLDGLG
jgi:hypothetical protein